MKSMACKGFLFGVGVLAAHVSVAAAPTGYSFQDLGAWGGAKSFALGMNRSGQVVGYAEWPAVGGASLVRHAVIWSNGQFVDLGPGVARSINSSGLVAGVSQDESGRSWATVWSNNVATRLGLGEAQGVNDQGHVVGEALGDDGVKRPVVWRNAVATVLSNSPGKVAAINNAGQMVGSVTETDPNGSPRSVGMRWVNDSTSLNLGWDAQPYAINDANVAVGASNAYQNTSVWYPDGKTQWFYRSNVPSAAYGINNVGWVVAHGYGEGTLWDVSSGAPVVINSLISMLVNKPQGLYQLMPSAINDKNQIVGQGCIGANDGTTSCHAFLLTPTDPAPCSVTAYASTVSNGFFRVGVSLRNERNVAATGWEVDLTMKNKTLVLKPVDAKVKAVPFYGTKIVATPTSSNQTIAANTSISFSFEGVKQSNVLAELVDVTATLGGQTCVRR